MTRRIRHYFDSVAARGGGRTRWIATMGWAASGVPGLEDFVPFEDHLNDVLRGRRDVIVCAYDVDQHDAALIADTVAVHPVTLIRGKLQPPSKAAPVSPRERILTAADDHFHAFGIRSTGVDTLIDAAGVAKATFYRTFSSKDELVVAWLRDRRPRWFYPMRDTLEESGLLPADRVPELFRLVADWLAQDGFRGCAFQNTAVEIVDSTHPVRALIRDYLDEIDEYLRRQVEAAGFAAPEELASQLGVLLAGALAAGAARHSRAPVVAALETAETLLRVAPRA
jgi:AcrR family transcriptional regulator